MEEEGRSKIEGLNEKLNSRTRYRDPLDKRSPVRELESPEITEKWQTPELDEMLKHELVVPAVNPFMKKVFIFALLFFIAAIGVAGFVFIGGATFVSSKNVDISVLGPTRIKAGEVLELGVIISNTNNADLELANLSIQYPPGSKNPDDTAKSLTYTKNDLGVIKTGSETEHNLRAVLFGSAGETKEIKFSVEYKVKGSNAVFYKDKIFEITIGEAPVTLTVESPPKTISGESFETTVSIVQNSTETLKNVVLKVEYPHGFSFIGATPEALTEDNFWALGDLPPGVKKTVKIRGQIVGENREERTSRFYVGISSGKSNNPDLGVIVASLSNTIAINRPSIGLNISFNGEEVPLYVAPDAREIKTTIRFQNNHTEKLYNPRLEIKLTGAALNKTSVSATDHGSYDPSTSKVVWNLTNIHGLPELAPGEGGRVSLTFSSLPGTSLSQNARDIKLDFTISAIEVSALGQRSFESNDLRTVKISSQVNFASKVLRTLSSFANHGPIPPKAKEETSYTVVFSIGNTRGDLVDAKVTAKLGRGVSWLGASSFASGGVSYDSTSNTVTWNLDMLRSDTGFSSATREQAFQIALTPFVDQIGTAPSLLTDLVFSGTDVITGGTITANNPPLTTKLTSDPAFIQGDDIVVK